MALDTRLIGKALGLGDPADIIGATEPAMQKGERIFAEQRARAEREQVRARREEIRLEDNNARAVGLLRNLDESGIAQNLRPYMIKNANIIRDEALEKIKVAQTPAEKIAATQEANQKINQLAAKSNDFNKYLANFDGLTQDDVSKLNQEGIGEQVGNILKGNFSITEDGNFNIGGQIASFEDVINTNYINKRSKKFLELLQVGNKVASTYGLQGVSDEFYKTELENSLKAVEMSDLDLLSVAVDYFGIKDFEGEARGLVERVKEDFDKDGDIDDVEARTELRSIINSRIKSAADEVFGLSKNEYNKKSAIEEYKKSRPSASYSRSIKSAVALKNKIIAERKNLGFEINPAGVIVGGSAQQPLELFEKNKEGEYIMETVGTGKEKEEIKVLSPKLQKTLDNLGWRWEAMVDDDGIRIKQQGGTKTIDLIEGQTAQSFIENILMLEGVDRQDALGLMFGGTESIYGQRAGFVPPSNKTDYNQFLRAEE